MDHMPMFQATWGAVLDILTRVLNDQPFSKAYFKLAYDQIHAYLNGDEYHTIYLQRYALFNAAENKRKEEAKKVAEAASKATGKTVQPVTPRDENEDNESNIPGAENYFAVKTFLQTHLEELAKQEENLRGEGFLRFYGKNWEKYQLISLILDRLYLEMNANWVRRQRGEQRTYIHEIYVLAMKLWNKTFFEKSTKILTEKCLELIRRERDGELVDKSLLKNVIQSYILVGASVDEGSRNARQDTLRPYKEHFEKELLRATEEYYTGKVQEYLAGRITMNYAQIVVARLRAEEQRVQDYLHETTRVPLLQILDRLLIANQITELQNLAIALIRSEDAANLNSDYQLLKRVPKSTEPVEKEFERYIRSVGLERMEIASTTATEDPVHVVYVRTVLEIYDRFRPILMRGFENDAKFAASLDKAFAELANNNALVQQTTPQVTPAMLLVKYCDMALSQKERSSADEDINERLNQIMVVFNYIMDKDSFKNYYARYLGRRLIGHTSDSIDNEESMINKLTAACGHEYTSNLQRMLKDVATSVTMCDAFRTHLREANDRSFGDFTTLIFTPGFGSMSSCTPFSLPRELLARIDTFTAFYTQRNQGKKISWVHQHSKCELTVLINGKTYELTTSMYQTAILFLFNQTPSHPIGFVLDQTNIEPEIFYAVLLHLIKKKIIECPELDTSRPLSELTKEHLFPEYTIQLSTKFRSNHRKINLNHLLKVTEQQEVKAVNQQTEEERKQLIQLAIVRVMKVRKVLRHNALIQEIVPQLTQRFRPELPKIKDCIAILMEGEYIRRDPADRELYHYIA